MRLPAEIPTVAVTEEYDEKRPATLDLVKAPLEDGELSGPPR